MRQTLGAIVFLACNTAVYAQDCATARDSVVMSDNVADVGDSIMLRLDEVVVEMPSVMTIGGKEVYMPPARLKRDTGTAVQLLAGLQIPELVVNPATGSVSIFGKENLSIRINGRRVSQSELQSLSPRDIVKVEYIRNPGVRYGDADAVLDVTVKRRDTGYGVIANILQSANRGWGDYTVSLKYNVGRSEWSADYHSNPMWHMMCFRDNRERIVLADGTRIDRLEEGMPVSNRMVTHRAAVQYSYVPRAYMLLNVQGRLYRKNDLYRSAGRVTASVGDDVSVGEECESSPMTSWQADIDLYFHMRFNSRNKIYVNIIPSCVISDSRRLYNATDLSVGTRITGRRWLLFGEGIWEGRLGHGTMSAGVRANVDRSHTVTYANMQNLGNDSHEGRYDTFAQWRQSFDKWEYEVGLTMALSRLETSFTRNRVNINPRLYLRYRPHDFIGMSLGLTTTTLSCGIADLNPSMQRIDRYQSYQGNQGLQPYQRHECRVEIDGRLRDMTAILSVENVYCHNPVMDYKEYMDGMIVGRPVNYGYNNDMAIKARMRVPLIDGRLVLSADGGWHCGVSSGRGYRHRYSQPFVNAQAMFMAGKWWVMLKYNTAYNRLWGETVASVTENLANIGIGYRWRSATFMAGLVNPVGNVDVKSSDMSALAGYEREYHAQSSSRLVWVGVTLNFYHGVRRAATRKRLDNKNEYESIKTISK